jgi:hypothetical protein
MFVPKLPCLKSLVLIVQYRSISKGMVDAENTHIYVLVTRIVLSNASGCGNLHEAFCSPQRRIVRLFLELTRCLHANILCNNYLPAYAPTVVLSKPRNRIPQTSNLSAERISTESGPRNAEVKSKQRSPPPQNLQESSIAYNKA